MLESIQIENYKSIEKVTLPLGRVNVFIGENGAGKSNILEAIALAGAAQASKLDNEFLTSRGIRVSGPELMRSAFKTGRSDQPIKVSADLKDGSKLNWELTNDNQPYSSWAGSSRKSGESLEKLTVVLREIVSSIKDDAERDKILTDWLTRLRAVLEKSKDESTAAGENSFSLDIDMSQLTNRPKIDAGGIEDFIIYSPENSSLRVFERGGQIEPLGINGEGLLKLLNVISNKKDKTTIGTIKESLKLFSWFEDFRIARGKSTDRIEIFDQFLSATTASFDQRSANEGFLYLAFYFALFTSDLTPRFFSIDNVDSSLNPKLCESLMRRLAGLAKNNDKQVLLTTHNPAILDGLDLGEDEQRLFIVSRASTGQTRVRRFEKKPTSKKPRRLSELFLNGMLGGLPKGF